jgi:hypothetical protein
MSTMLRLLVAASFLATVAPHTARADAPPPSQVLTSDPSAPRPSFALTADGAAIVLGDYAARLDVLLAPFVSIGLLAGASHRAASDDILLEGDGTLWLLCEGLEGPFVSGIVGLAWAGPWTQEPGVTPRLGGQAGWQFLWESLVISLGGGAHAAFRPDGVILPEVRVRAALGVLF